MYVNLVDRNYNNYLKCMIQVINYDKNELFKMYCCKISRY